MIAGQWFGSWFGAIGSTPPVEIIPRVFAIQYATQIFDLLETAPMPQILQTGTLSDPEQTATSPENFSQSAEAPERYRMSAEYTPVITMSKCPTDINALVGAQIDVILTVVDSRGAAVDMTGRDVGVYFGSTGAPPVISLTVGSGVTVVDGRVEWTLTGTQTTALGSGTWAYEVWDLDENKPLHTARTLRLTDSIRYN